MDTLPKSVSIVVPVYNDPSGISQTINSLAKQNYPSSELFITDNGSTDGTRNVIQDYTKVYSNVYRLIEDKIQGSYAARNKGIKYSDGDILAFIDSDETVSSDWLETALQTMQSQEADYLGCNVELTLIKDTLVGRYNAHTGFPVKQYLKEQNYAPTCALLVRREVFEDIGLFDDRLISGGDREFGERVHEAGYKQGYAKNATVYHPARTTFESLAEKNFRVGRGFCQKQHYYPERYGKPGIPPAPSGPSGGDDEDEPDSLFTRFAFAFLSFAMLTCRGVGYYYEFFFGEERGDVPSSTS